MVPEPGPRPSSRPSAFLDTQWTVVRAAAGRRHPDGTDAPAAHAAFAQLCRDYWSPLYAYVRRCGYGQHDAQDLTQGFFVHLLDGRLMDQADAGKGRFRSFLLTALKNFLSDERDRAGTQRRGGKYRFVPLEEAEAAETRFGSALAATPRGSPGDFYEAQWAAALVDAALDRLREDLHGRGRGALLDRLRPFLVGGEELSPDREAAQSLGLTPNALRTAYHRLRRQYGQFLREEVARTVTGAEEVDAEVRHLCTVLARQAG